MQSVSTNLRVETFQSKRNRNYSINISTFSNYSSTKIFYIIMAWIYEVINVMCGICFWKKGTNSTRSRGLNLIDPRMTQNKFWTPWYFNIFLSSDEEELYSEKFAKSTVQKIMVVSKRFSKQLWINRNFEF